MVQKYSELNFASFFCQADRPCNRDINHKLTSHICNMTINQIFFTNRIFTIEFWFVHYSNTEQQAL